jgi:RNA polymerase-associated protein LEO1
MTIISSASPSASPPRAEIRRSKVSQSATPRGSPTPSTTRTAESYNALEHREISAEPPMGVRDINGAPADIQEASFTLPSLPFRRGIPHYFARLPNLLQYRSEVFDEDEFDEEKEDELLQNREAIRIDDEGLRSLLTTSNTIRWRWSGKVDEDGFRISESNARIVKWNDGSSSLQLGSEFYDISQSTERVQSVEVKSASSQSGVPLQPDQHLTHLFIKHDGQEQVNMYQSEAPIMGTFTFRPTSTKSESHQRLAKAVRKQKGTLVKETVVREDPELEKERKEKEEKKASQKRMRESKKRTKGKEDEDDDAFWDSAARSARRTGARSLVSSGLDGELPNGVDERELEEGVDDDGFVVDDDLDDDLDAEGSDEADMDVDDEPDEMELMEAEMEKQEALRKAGKLGRGEGDKGETPAPKEEDEAATSAPARKRRVIDSDEE